jgi:hypothetical protein
VGEEVAAVLVARSSVGVTMIREKGRNIFESILYEAETGAMFEGLWDEEPPDFARAKRRYARQVVARSGDNKSEAARRLGVSRVTVVRCTEPSQH